MIQKEIPDSYIKIGIKNKRVVEVDWSGMLVNGIIFVPKKIVTQLLKEAIKFIKR